MKELEERIAQGGMKEREKIGERRGKEEGAWEERGVRGTNKGWILINHRMLEVLDIGPVDGGRHEHQHIFI